MIMITARLGAWVSSLGFYSLRRQGLGSWIRILSLRLSSRYAADEDADDDEAHANNDGDDDDIVLMTMMLMMLLLMMTTMMMMMMMMLRRVILVSSHTCGYRSSSAIPTGAHALQTSTANRNSSTPRKFAPTRGDRARTPSPGLLCVLQSVSE